jgi:glycerol-3-phosphate acyltransferase PlsY
MLWIAGDLFWPSRAALLDGLKGAIPVGIAYDHVHHSGWSFYFAALAPLIGHLYSPFLKFRGGKGLATTFGIWLGLTHWIGPILLARVY